MSDLISRQELLNAISQKEYGHDYDGNKDILGLKYVDIIKRMPSVEPEKCGDCISRQDVLDLAKSGKLVSNGNYKSVCDAINGLPSVEPERKPGKWIRGEAYPHHIYCSECYKTFIPNDEFRVWANGDIPRKYCPSCGAKMEVDNG